MALNRLFYDNVQLTHAINHAARSTKEDRKTIETGE